MDKEKLKAYGVDYENAVKRFAGNEALYEKFLKKLTEDDHLAIGEQAMKEERYEDVFRAVHALKGVAGTLGMTELFQAASEVVASIRKNEINPLLETPGRSCRFCRFAPRIRFHTPGVILNNMEQSVRQAHTFAHRRAA